MSGIVWNEVSANSSGGTELMARQLEKRMPADLMKEYQITISRMRDLDQTKVRILWEHDLPGDPEADKALGEGGWNRFHKIVFVSNWQQQAFCAHYHIPWGRCVVLLNAIEPIDSDVVNGITQWNRPDPNEVVRLVYTSTPHRGLGLLYPAFKKLQETHGKIELVVYSSFNLYGWPERDKEYEALFEVLEKDPTVKLHNLGTPNKDVKEALKGCHIFAYPSVWMETSCLCLMEAMSAKLLCVHPNFAALPETAANWTMMYQWNDDVNVHATQHYSVLGMAVNALRDPKAADQIKNRLDHQKAYADAFYNWNTRSTQWELLLRGLVNEPRDIKTNDQGMFVYRAAWLLPFLVPTLIDAMNSVWSLMA